MGAPNLRAVDAELPDPPYPADTKANGWKPQFDVATIVSSDTWTLAEDDERPWLLRVWFECWNSVPAGSMPSDRRLFSRRIGCKVAFLNAHAEVLLRGWTRHNDDLLYHDHVTGQINEMLSKRINTKTKVAAWRERNKNKRVASTDDESVTGYQPVTTTDVTRCNRLVTDRKGKDKEKDKDKDLLLAEKKEKDLLRKSQKKTEKTKSTPTARGARLNLESLPADWAAWTKDKRPDLDPAEVFESFRDYWIGVPGQKGVKVDWLATWRNWCRRQDAPNAKRSGGGFKTKEEILAEKNKASGDAWLAEMSATDAIDGEFKRVG